MKNKVYYIFIGLCVGAVLVAWVSGPKGLPHHITIGCECGNYLTCYISYQPEHWPLDITCIDCETRYITTREQLKCLKEG